MAVRYRFKSEANFSQIFFNGMNISVEEVKNAIYQQRKLGRSENVNLMISNAENGEKFIEDSTLIPKNSSLIVVRVPGSTNNNSKTKKFIKSYENNKNSENIEKYSIKNLKPQKYPKILTSDLSSMPGSEEEKIFAMMMQSTIDYNNNNIFSQQSHATNYSHPPPPTYICHRCHTAGHWIQKCSQKPLKNFRFDPKSRMTGIPMSMRFKSEEKYEKIYTKNFEILNKEIFAKYFCEICKEIFRNPTLTPCCKSTFCYDCIEKEILESDEHECPKCGEKYLMLSQLKANEEAWGEILRIRGNFRH